MEPGISSGFGTAATMLGGSAALGYIVTGLLAFILGVCVTIACFRICLLHKDEQSEEQKGDNMRNLPITLCNSLLPCWAFA